MADAYSSSQGAKLDGPPPAPPGRPQPAPATASMSAMAPASPPLGANAAPQALIERAVAAEQALTALVRLAPDLGPVIAQQIDQLRAAVGGLLQGGSSGPASPMMGGGMGMMSGMSSTPTPSVGAGGPPMA